MLLKLDMKKDLKIMSAAQFSCCQSTQLNPEQRNSTQSTSATFFILFALFWQEGPIKMQNLFFQGVLAKEAALDKISGQKFHIKDYFKC